MRSVSGAEHMREVGREGTEVLPSRHCVLPGQSKGVGFLSESVGAMERFRAEEG